LAQEGWKFLELYDVFEDEVYFHSKTEKILKFRMTDKYSIPVGANVASTILQGLKNEGTIVS
jgi:hypothetical protein